jgi:hypothetical protein
MAGGYTRMAHRNFILTENNGDELEKSFKQSASTQFARSEPARYSHFYSNFGILNALKMFKHLDFIG